MHWTAAWRMAACIASWPMVPHLLEELGKTTPERPFTLD